MNESTNKKGGFSILALLFAPQYYAGYGKFGRGSIFCILICINSILGLIAYIYAGFKAKSELPVGEKPFAWGPCVGMIVLHILLAVIATIVEISLEGE